jgi:hypothetical protein
MRSPVIWEKVPGLMKKVRTRRDFIKDSALLAGSLAFFGGVGTARAAENYSVVPEDGYFSLQLDDLEFMRIHEGFPVRIQPNPYMTPDGFGSEAYLGPMPLEPEEGAELSDHFTVTPEFSVAEDSVSVSMSGDIPGQDLVAPVGAWAVNISFIYQTGNFGNQTYFGFPSVGGTYSLDMQHGLLLRLVATGSHLNPNAPSFDDCGDTYTIWLRGEDETTRYENIEWAPLKDGTKDINPYRGIPLIDAWTNHGIGSVNGTLKPVVETSITRTTKGSFEIKGRWDNTIVDPTVKNLQSELIQQPLSGNTTHDLFIGTIGVT